jgi:hypothetical protein
LDVDVTVVVLAGNVTVQGWAGMVVVIELVGPLAVVVEVLSVSCMKDEQKVDALSTTSTALHSATSSRDSSNWFVRSTSARAGGRACLECTHGR